MSGVADKINMARFSKVTREPPAIFLEKANSGILIVNLRHAIILYG